MSAAKSLKSFACKGCSEIPKSHVLSCPKSHMYCIDCALKKDNVCQCGGDLKLKQNPLEAILATKSNIDCPNKSKGCTWTFPAKDMDKHVIECKFATRPCVGNSLNIWKCTWKGAKHNMVEHLKTYHSVHHNLPHKGAMPLDFQGQDQDSTSSVKLIDAFNKPFILYHEYDKSSETVNFLIFALGTNATAKHFYYEFEIFSTVDPNSKIKFTQSCWSDSANIVGLIKDGKCISLSYKIAKNFANLNSLNCRYEIFKNPTECQKDGNHFKKGVEHKKGTGDFKKGGGDEKKNFNDSTDTNPKKWVPKGNVKGGKASKN